VLNLNSIINYCIPLAPAGGACPSAFVANVCIPITVRAISSLTGAHGHPELKGPF